jgi:hypothetical protein
LQTVLTPPDGLMRILDAVALAAAAEIPASIGRRFEPKRESRSRIAMNLRIPASC